MEDAERTLIVVLTMHRSGSSLTMNILRDLGVSLGPWELLAAHPSNPKGHFESMPVLELSREIQTLVHGFIDDLPRTSDDTAAFLERQARWDEHAESVAAPFLERGRGLIEGLTRSGRFSGFKDPRTVLIWPFWKRVFEAFPHVRIVPVALVRSPHEIAMSLFDRSGAECGYWTCLDVVAVHFQKLGEIVSQWRGPLPTVRFGGLDYFTDLERAALACGLEWSEEAARSAYDGAHVHQRPAVLVHRAQALYDSIAGAAAGASEALRSQNTARLDADSRRRDQLQLERLREARGHIAYFQYQYDQARGTAEQLARGLEQSQEESRRALETIQRLKAESGGTVERLEAERDSALARREAAERAAEQARDAWLELRTMVDRIESHPLLGPVFRGRRGIKRIISRLSY